MKSETLRYGLADMVKDCQYCWGSLIMSQVYLYCMYPESFFPKLKVVDPA